MINLLPRTLAKDEKRRASLSTLDSRLSTLHIHLVGWGRLGKFRLPRGNSVYRGWENSNPDISIPRMQRYTSYLRKCWIYLKGPESNPTGYPLDISSTRQPEINHTPCRYNRTSGVKIKPHPLWIYPHLGRLLFVLLLAEEERLMASGILGFLQNVATHRSERRNVSGILVNGACHITIYVITGYNITLILR